MPRVGDVALGAGVPVHELRSLSTDLESLYFALTSAPENRNRNLDETPQDVVVPPVETLLQHDVEGARS
jgi:ABC-2 type transport system ATP-binding protein